MKQNRFIASLPEISGTGNHGLRLPLPGLLFFYLESSHLLLVFQDPTLRVYDNFCDHGRTVPVLIVRRARH